MATRYAIRSLNSEGEVDALAAFCAHCFKDKKPIAPPQCLFRGHYDWDVTDCEQGSDADTATKLSLRLVALAADADAAADAGADADGLGDGIHGTVTVFRRQLWIC